MFFWILVWDLEGKYRLMGPYNSYTQAYRVADRLDVAGYEIEKLPTMNSEKATRLVKRILIEKEPEKFKKYTKRFKHGKAK